MEIQRLNNMEEFVYTGRGQTVPKDVVSVRFDPIVTEVEEDAFYDCNNLRQVVFNEGLKKIREGSFSNCGSLQIITLPSTLTEIGRRAFESCNSLREVVFNKGLQKIGECAFLGCTSLESSITLPSTTDIGMFAFQNCWCLREVGLHEGLQTIGDYAFSGCSSLERLTFPGISNRLNIIMQTGHYPIVEAKLDEARGVVERRGNELFVRVIRGDSNWNTIKASLDQIVSWIRYFEIKEATSLFELALWKAKIDQADEATDINHEAYRIEVPGPVKNAILQYL